MKARIFFGLFLRVLLLGGLLSGSGRAGGEETPQPTRLIPYKTVGDVTLRLHVFEPEGLESTDRRPAIVFFFGGGWVGGSPSQFYPHCAHLAARGWVAMAAEYRVKQRHGTTPYECVKDGKSALRWVRSHAAELGIAPDHLAAGGGSAGGQVAAATATVRGFNEAGEDTAVSARPNALVLFNPVFDNGPDGWGYERVAEHWREFSPLHNLRPGVPPTIIFLGTRDKLVPVATAQRYQSRMKELGVPCELHLYEGQGHGFFNYGRDHHRWYRETVAAMDRFLAERRWPAPPTVGVRPALEAGWEHPPREARLRAYWWWLNGNVTANAITRDLEAMKAQGWGGALICDAGGSAQDGNARVPHGPDFFSPAWRALYRHALREAHRLGLEMSLNIQSGWNLGGPMVPPEDAPKQLTWTARVVEGPTTFAGPLAQPPTREGYYRDLFVLAYRVPPDDQRPRPLLHLEEKALRRALHFSAPDTRPLLEQRPARPGERDCRMTDVRDLTERLAPDGTLRWEAPPGRWEILRLGCTLNAHCHVSTCSQGWEGYALDPFDAGAFTRYWDAVVEPLIADAGALAGTTLKYLHTDSWEVEVANWTPTLRAEFRQRRGYDLLPWLPVITGRLVNSREESNRFLNDLRRTLGDLAIDHHYRLFRDRAHRHGLKIHPESGGPHAVPIDAQQCLGFDDAPMSEFWARSWRHRVGDPNRFFVKQPASAAHAYGHRLVLAEGFTTIGPHWQLSLWDNLKPSFDQACCEGLNLLVWHAFVCSPAAMGLPGQQYFAGTHVNPNVTWWDRGRPFFAYLNRCQWLLQQGRFVADVACYYGDHVPNFAQLKASDPAGARPGYDYDVLPAEVILHRLQVRDGRLTLPDGMSYRLLVLPNRDAISLPVLRRLKELVHAGATVMGPRPRRATSWQNYPDADAEVRRLADALWGGATGKGRILKPRPAREALADAGVPPDFTSAPDGAAEGAKPALDYLHRRLDETDLYFVAHRANQAVSRRCTFRVSGKAPELWNPVTGERRFVAAYTPTNGCTTLTLDFPPCGSWFVVFREPAAAHPPTAPDHRERFLAARELSGPWTVAFDPDWGGPARTEFLRLASWTEQPEPGIRHYSGAAIYRQTFAWTPAEGKPGDRWWLNLGDVRELAEVRLNGHPLGILWSPPFRVEITPYLRPGENRLAVDVVNFWPNRLIGDAALPPDQRRTRTNIRKLTRDTPLMPSGLLGPVRLERTPGR